LLNDGVSENLQNKCSKSICGCIFELFTLNLFTVGETTLLVGESFVNLFPFTWILLIVNHKSQMVTVMREING